MSTDKEKYIAFAGNRDDLRIYNKPFWLDAVCGSENWDAIVVEENSELMAALPYCRNSDRRGISGILQPQLTQCFDLWTKPIQGCKHEKYLAHQFRWLGEIAEGLLSKGADYIDINLSSGLDNWEPFYWAGFSQQTRYSFVIDKSMNMEQVWDGMDETQKRVIRKASENVTVEELWDIDLLYRYMNYAFTERGMANPVSPELVKRLCDYARDNHSVRMMVARDKEDICCAGLYVFDSRCVYELIVGTDPAKKKMNGKAVMTYEMIRFACESGRSFDFEGSMIRSVAEHNRRFGAVMVPYHEVWKVNTQNPLKRAAVEKKYGR